MFEISPTTRLRQSPFYRATVAAGVTGFTVYNHMLMPTGFGDPEAEYWRLIEGVSQWDVAVERQVQLAGPDAAQLAQILSPRKLDRCVAGQGKYVALCNHAGTLINDPILHKIDDDRFWLSIADSNILFWARAIAAERGLDVEVSEPDVSPMAIQGPKADDVVAAVAGDWIRELKYFWFRFTDIDGIPVVVSRSGWSKQGGYELYLLDGSRGTDLWNIINEAGRPFGIGPGNPNPVERVESGLLSWGGDTDDATNPFEVRMGRYVDTDVGDDVIGIQALRQTEAEGPKRHQLGIILDGAEPLPPATAWCGIYANGERVGDMTNRSWSYRMKQTIGFALIAVACKPGQQVEVSIGDEVIGATLTDLPFL